jgi:hypothetical protein
VRCTIEASGMQVFALCIGNDVGNASDGEHEGVLVRWEKDDPSFPPVPPLRGTLDPCGTRSVGISQSKHYLLDHCKFMVRSFIMFVLACVGSCFASLFREDSG